MIGRKRRKSGKEEAEKVTMAAVFYGNSETGGRRMRSRGTGSAFDGYGELEEGEGKGEGEEE